jgi:hypothetical protein
MDFKAQCNSDFKGILNGEFAEDLTISDGQTTVNFKGIFDETYQQIDPDTNAVIMSKKPRVSLLLNDVAFKIKQGHTVGSRNKTYKVRELQPDGEGSITLYLD